MEINNAAAVPTFTLEDFEKAGSSREGNSKCLLIQHDKSGKARLVYKAPSLWRWIVEIVTGSSQSKKNKDTIEAFKQAIENDIYTPRQEERTEQERSLFSDLYKYLDACQGRGLEFIDVLHVLKHVPKLPTATLASPTIAVPLSENEEIAEEILERGGNIDNHSRFPEHDRFVRGTLRGGTYPLPKAEVKIPSKENISIVADEVMIDGKKVSSPMPLSVPEPILARPLLHEKDQNRVKIGERYFIVDPFSTHSSSAQKSKAQEAHLMSEADQREEENVRGLIEHSIKILTPEEAVAIRREEEPVLRIENRNNKNNFPRISSLFRYRQRPNSQIERSVVEVRPQERSSTQRVFFGRRFWNRFRDLSAIPSQ